MRKRWIVLCAFFPEFCVVARHRKCTRQPSVVSQRAVVSITLVNQL